MKGPRNHNKADMYSLGVSLDSSDTVNLDHQSALDSVFRDDLPILYGSRAHFRHRRPTEASSLLSS